MSSEGKKRLSLQQVRALESSFREERKLEPGKKSQLAKDLGLEPRQVAVWFQNRRVRSKNKQLERDFQGLKQDYHLLKANYDSLFEETVKIQSEVERLNTCVESMSKAKAQACEPCASPSENNVAESDNSEANNNQTIKIKNEEQEQLSSTLLEDSPHYVDQGFNNHNHVEIQHAFWCNPEVTLYPLYWEL